MMEGKVTWCNRDSGGSVCLCHCSNPHHLIFCFLQDMMNLFETNISDMVDSFVVTVKATYPFLCASATLMVHPFPILNILIPDSELVAEIMLPSTQFNEIRIHFWKEFPWRGQTFSQCQDLENSYYEKICANAQTTLENMAEGKLEVDVSETAERVSVSFHLKCQE